MPGYPNDSVAELTFLGNNIVTKATYLTNKNVCVCHFMLYAAKKMPVG